MDTTPFSMSGLIRLSEEHFSMLTAMGLNPPEIVTLPLFEELLAKAEVFQAAMPNPMLARMTRETIDEMRESVAHL